MAALSAASRSPRRPSGRVTALGPVVASPRARSSIRPRTTPPAPPRRPRRRNPPTLPPDARRRLDAWRRMMRFASARWWASSSNGAWSAVPLGAVCPSASPTAAAADAVSRRVATSPRASPSSPCPSRWESAITRTATRRTAGRPCPTPPGASASRVASSRNATSPTTPNGRPTSPSSPTSCPAPPSCGHEGARAAVSPRRRGAAGMRERGQNWHAKLEAACPSALAGADVDSFAAAVSVVRSRTYGVASADGEGYRRFSPRRFTQPREAVQPPPRAPARAGDNITWSTLDDDGTPPRRRAVRPARRRRCRHRGGPRSFSMYYGFTRRNPPGVVLFSDVEHALSWHMVYHPEMWTRVRREANTRESAARAAFAVERALAETGRRIPPGRVQGTSPEVVATRGSCRSRRRRRHGRGRRGWEAGRTWTSNRHRDVRRVRGVAATDADDSRRGKSRMTPGISRPRRTERTRRKCSWTPSSTWGRTW